MVADIQLEPARVGAARRGEEQPEQGGPAHRDGSRLNAALTAVVGSGGTR